MSRLLRHMDHPPPAPPTLFGPLSDPEKGALYATLSLVIVTMIIVLAIGGCVTRLLCALRVDEPTTEKEELKKDEVEGGTSTSGVMPTVKPAMPMISQVAHVLAIVVSAVIAVCVATVLSDGRSVIKLKDPQYLPTVTDPSLKHVYIDHRLDELLGPTYGIGLLYDQSGHTWTQISAGKTLQKLIDHLGMETISAAIPSVVSTDDLKHPVPFLECNELKSAGLCACCFGFIAEAVAVLMVIFHSLSLVGVVPSSKGKPLAALVWFVLTTGFLIVDALAIGIYTATWHCQNQIIPSIKLMDHFNYNYGFPFAIIGFVCSLLVLNIILFCTSMKDSAVFSSLKAIAAKIVGGLLFGMTTGAVIALIVLGSVGYFDPAAPVSGNPCENQKPTNADFGAYGAAGDHYFKNTECTNDAGIIQVLEQAGANVTKGFRGTLDAADRVPITKPYSEMGLCPVNVHWHLGAEHLNVGEFDAEGTSPMDTSLPDGPRSNPDSKKRELKFKGFEDKSMARGYACHHYKNHGPGGKEPLDIWKKYDFDWCKKMYVGETYEIHWPHSAAGACGTRWQYQYPFYDGVFCKDGIIKIAPLNTYEKIGVQSQVFTVVNSDEPQYQYDDLFGGMIVDASTGHGQDIAMYTGSTTGTSRSNTKCSRYTPITWQVDRKCHMISAKSFDKLCKDMRTKTDDDMYEDLYPHGSRAISWQNLTANNQQSRI